MIANVPLKVARVIATKTFHCPVGAYLSARVCRKLCRYTETRQNMVPKHTSLLESVGNCVAILKQDKTWFLNIPLC